MDAMRDLKPRWQIKEDVGQNISSKFPGFDGWQVNLAFSINKEKVFMRSENLKMHVFSYPTDGSTDGIFTYVQDIPMDGQMIDANLAFYPSMFEEEVEKQACIQLILQKEWNGVYNNSFHGYCLTTDGTLKESLNETKQIGKSEKKIWYAIPSKLKVTGVLRNTDDVLLFAKDMKNKEGLFCIKSERQKNGCDELYKWVKVREHQDCVGKSVPRPSGLDIARVTGDPQDKLWVWVCIVLASLSIIMVVYSMCTGLVSNDKRSYESTSKTSSGVKSSEQTKDEVDIVRSDNSFGT